MTRRLVNITLDNLDDIPRRCRKCVFWELDPVAGARASETGDTELEKEAWVSAVLLEWGSCGKICYVDGVPAGYVMFAPASYVPRARRFESEPRRQWRHISTSRGVIGGANSLGIRRRADRQTRAEHRTVSGLG